jgi:hypothetical protein
MPSRVIYFRLFDCLDDVEMSSILSNSRFPQTSKEFDSSRCPLGSSVLDCLDHVELSMYSW